MTVVARDLFDLSGRVAIITGGAGLLGRQHAAVITEFGGTAVIADVRAGAAKAAAAEVKAEAGGEPYPIALPWTSPMPLRWKPWSPTWSPATDGSTSSSTTRR